jgi:hypothetical protein
MKTKFALLAIMLSAVSGAFAGQPASRVIYDSKGHILAVVRSDATANAPAKPSLKPCCDTRTNVMPNPSGKGVNVTKSIVCNTGCAAPHAGKSCTAAERKQCAN